MRAHPLQSNVNPSAAPLLSPSLNQQSIYSRSTESLCVCTRLSCAHIHTNEMAINDRKTEPGRDNDLNLRQLSNEQI